MPAGNGPKVAALALLAALACAPATGRAAELTQLRVNAFPNAKALPLHAGIAMGIFARHGLDLQLQLTENSRSQRDGLAAGHFDIAQAALDNVLYPSGAPMSDAIVRGEVAMGPLLYNIVYTKTKEGAPIDAVFAPEGMPINPYADGIPKTAKNPNAAKLFMNWRLSVEEQTFMIKELGNITSLKDPPFYPKGWDPKVIKVWVPDFDQYVKLQSAWVEEWNKTYNYRQ